MFKFPDEWIERRKEIYELKYVTYKDKKIHVSELEDRSVTPEMRNEMRMNSYAQEDLPPKLNNEALIEKAKYYMSQCSRTRVPCSTYDEALIHNITPELVKRLGEEEQRAHFLKSMNIRELAMHLEHVLIHTESLDPNMSVNDFLNFLQNNF